MQAKNNELLFRIAKSMFPFFVVAVACFSIGAGLYLHFAPKEAKEYKAQPVTQNFPLCWDVESLPSKAGTGTWENVAKRAAKGLNKQLGKVFWVHAKVNKAFCKARNTIAISPARAEEKSFPSGRCQPLLNKPEAPWERHDLVTQKTLAWFDYPKRRIVLCVDKIEQAYSAAFQDNNLARKIRNAGGDGRVTIIRHEMGHALLTKHVVWGCGLMCASPNVGHFSKREIEIIKRLTKFARFAAGK